MMKRKRNAPRGPRKGVPLVALLGLLFFGGGFLTAWLMARQAPPLKRIPAVAKAEPEAYADADAAAVTPAPPAERPDGAPEPASPRIAIIIDDIGRKREPVERLLALGVPVTFSVMPDQPHTGELAARIAAAGGEVMLHLPMEPEDEKLHDPGAGALLVTEPDEDIRAAIARGFAQVPQAKGVNNHMGSLFTRDERKMEVALTELKAKGLFFIDSLTTPESVGRDVARRLGIKSAGRRVFLDNDQDEAAIERRLRLAIGLALKEKRVVAIGHPYPETVAALEKLKGEFARAGVAPVFASQVVR